MSTDIPARSAETGSDTASAWADGLTFFAAAMMMIIGCWQALTGFAALVKDDLYVVTPQYIYSFDLTAWGWVHLLLGALIAVAGFAVWKGQMWGRVTGVVAASLNMIVNFAFLPYYPFWSILIIVLDAAVIWALCTHRRTV